MAGCASDKGTDSQAPKLELLSQEQIFSGAGNYDSLLQFRFYYEDLDGDIGLDESDTAGDFAWGSPYFYTFFCYLKTFKNGIWMEVPNPFNPSENLQFHERFPNLTPKSRDKRLNGELELVIPARPNSVQLDTIRFEMQLVDRALHKSKICYSKDFILKHP